VSLLSELDDSRLVVTDEDLGVLFVWYGGPAVFILDEQGVNRGEFRMSTAYERNLEVHEVYAAIKAHQQDMYEDEEDES
jgi:hypothetical protein